MGQTLLCVLLACLCIEMYVGSARSGGVGVCVNSRTDCETLALSGHCKLNKEYMEKYCCDSCKGRDVHVKSGWGQWHPWSACTETCGRATRMRIRHCYTPTGRPCTGAQSEIEQCTTKPCKPRCLSNLRTGCATLALEGHCRFSKDYMQKYCCLACKAPVHGAWGQWQSWSSCSSSCNQGSRMRIRKCDSPKPSDKGRTCRGASSETEQCSEKPCKPKCLFDRRTDCATLALNGECHISKTYMQQYCCLSCKGKEECKDSFNSAQCRVMAARGECVKNKNWMWKKCCNACKKKGRCVNLGGSTLTQNCAAHANSGACNKAATRGNMWRYCCADCLKAHIKEKNCVNKNQFCNLWAGVNECKMNPTFMSNTCCRACKNLRASTRRRACSNYNTYCNIWAASGQCRLRPAYMSQFCCLSCWSRQFVG